MPDIERPNRHIPFQGQARPGGISLSADQIREVLALMKEYLPVFQKPTFLNLKNLR